MQGQFTAFYFPPNQRLTKIDPATGAATGERNSIPVVYYGGTGGALTYGQSDRNAPLGTLGVIGTVGLNEQARLGNFATVQLPGATIFNTVLRGSASTGDVNIGVFGTTTESPQITVGSFIDAGDYRFVTRDLNPYRMLPGGYTISTRNGVSVTEKVGPPSSSGMPLLITPNPGSPGSAGRFLKPPEGFFNIPGLPGSQQLPSPTTTPSPTSTPTPSSPTSFTLPNYQGGQVEAAPVSTDTNGQTLYRVTWTGSSGRTESFDMKLTGQIGTDQFAEGTPSSMELKRRINR